MAWIRVVQHRGHMAGCFVNGSETWGSIRLGISWFAENSYLLQKDSSLWSY
jgi:hypothetical protein